MRTYATFSPASPRSTLNTVPAAGASASPVRAGSNSAIPRINSPIPAPVRAEPKKTGCARSAPVARASAARTCPGVIALASSTYAASSSSSRSATSSTQDARRPDIASGASSLRHLPEHAFPVGAGAVGLVHEQQRRNAQALQRAHQQPCLRLHALDRRDDEHRAVEHAEHALDLGDEVRVARRVDEVDGDVVERERDDGGFDRDPAPPLERECVGLRRAVVDAADLVDDAGGIEQPLGESCLTGVYVRQDPKVERSVQQASYPPNRS